MEDVLPGGEQHQAAYQQKTHQAACAAISSLLGLRMSRLDPGVARARSGRARSSSHMVAGYQNGRRMLRGAVEYYYSARVNSCPDPRIRETSHRKHHWRYTVVPSSHFFLE